MNLSLPQKRVSVNRSRSSLTLGYDAMLDNNNDFMHQLASKNISREAAPKKIDLPPKSSFQLKSSLRTSASAPCSPNKTVSFSQQEDVCLFRKAQTPLAISQKNNTIFWANDDEESSSSSSSSDDDENTKLIYPNWPERDIFNNNKMLKIDKNQIELLEDVIYGKVSIKNLHFHKSVTIRYTWNFWESFDNVQAQFYEGHKNYDVFEFKIPLLPHQHHLYFAISYTIGNQEYWDNNHGRNYELKMVSQQQQDNTNNNKPRYDFGQHNNAPTTTMTSSSFFPPPSANTAVDLNSESYMDLVNKYCFYSTSPTTTNNRSSPTILL